jgi:outer membrane immunogenic protein
MKKQLICGIVSSVVLTAAATAALAETCFEGFYTGISLGGSFTNGHLTKGKDLSLTALGQTGTATFSSKHDLRKNAGVGALYLGYGSFSDYFYLGGELFADWTHRKAKGTQDYSVSLAANPLTLTDMTNVKLNGFEYGVDLRPGYKLTNDSLVYARVGVAFNKLKATETLTVGSGTTASQFVPLSKKKNVAALRVGAGIEQGICENLVLRADYIYTYYGKVNAKNSSNLATSNFNSSAAARSTAKLSNNTVMLGLSYYW